jgi:putative membrane-bound dehydrogenase-like protein
MFRLALLSALALPALAVAQMGPPPGTHQVKLNGHTFTLPVGFTIELAAGADLAPRPIVCDFDDKGRLYVCDSSGSNEKVAVQLETKPHRIVRLADTNGDGKFDKQTVFVKNVMFPEGAMWLKGSLYVAAPPHILKFTDTDDDGVADKEEIWFDGKTLTGCANDLHGPYRGPDGWIYWCKGAFAKQEYTLPNGKKFTTRASHIFRARPDGTGIEPVMTGGMDNPVDLVFTPGGDIIFSTTFFQRPADGKRDGLIHAVTGAVYGKDHDPVYEHPWTHPTLMPPMTHMGPAAPCGLHRLESGEFGKDYENNVFCCQFNLRKVSRHVLVPTGSTYTTKDSDFVVSDNIDFHPTDVIEDADGSLLIVDTGGWYKLCCPTSQLVKPDVTGAIYRVKKVGAHKIEDPRGEKIEWKKMKAEEIAQLMGDPRPAVQHRAIDILAAGGDEAHEALLVLPLTPFTPKAAELNSIWALTRRKGLMERRATKNALRLFDEEYRLAAAHSLGLWRHEKAEPPFNQLSPLCKLVQTDTPRVRRAAAEALGRIGDPKAIGHILAALEHKDNDRALDHALTYALIEIGDAKETAKGLTHESPRVRRAVIAALSNMPDAGLDAKAVLAELDSPDAALRETAWWVAGRNPQWGGELAGYFGKKLRTAGMMKPEERDELAERLKKFAAAPAVQGVLADALGDAKSAPLACSVLARSGLKAMPKAWAEALVNTLPANPKLLTDAVEVFRVLPATAEQYRALVDATEKALAKLDRIPDRFAVRLAAAAPPGVLDLDRGLSDSVGEWIAADAPADVRALAADVLARHRLSSQQFAAVAGMLGKVNALELPRLLNLFEKSKDENVGLALVGSLRRPELLGAIRVEMVKPILDKYPKRVRDEAEKLYAELAEARKDERAKLDKLLAGLKPGDVRRGQLVFNSAKTQCIACHKVGYVGGTVGPDLTRIGGIRSERDLLEAIVFPNASFVRSYEPVRVVTADERVFNGVLKKDAPDEVIVAVAADKDERIARADVDSITPSTISLMPSGLEQQLTPQDLADLVAFLKACK